jgi:HAE1 family hydrophobic/amphiphilic exporter-1
VVFVVIVFLQSWRTALIPIIAIPVSLVGTFAVMALFGFSLNTLTLFGLVLAIGIVVDDAIVVVENVERNIALGLSPRDAAHRTMDEVGGAVVAIALVLSAVFIPTAFIPGITGQFYRQFALTIAASTISSSSTRGSSARPSGRSAPCPRASSRPRTRATSSPWCSSPTARPSPGPTMCSSGRWA